MDHIVAVRNDMKIMTRIRFNLQDIYRTFMYAEVGQYHTYFWYLRISWIW